MTSTTSYAINEIQKGYSAEFDQRVRYDELYSYIRILQKKIKETPAGEYKNNLKRQLATSKNELYWLMLSL